MSVEILPHAQVDIDSGVEDILDALGPGAARLFQRRLLETFTRLERHPLSVAVREPISTRFPELRIVPVHRFKGRVVCYQPIPDGIRVVRVLLAACDLDAIFS